VGPPACRTRPPPARSPAPHQRAGLRPVARADRHQTRRVAAHHPGPGRPRPASSGQGRRLPRHQRHPSTEFCAVATGPETHRHPSGQPRRGTRHRPRRRAVRRPDLTAQGHRPDHLLLPSPARQAGRIPDRSGQSHPHSRARHRRRGQPGLPRRHALGHRRRARKALRTKQIRADPISADILRRRRRQPHPALRQRRPGQGHPEQRSPRLRRPLAPRHRPRPEAAHHGQQGHHPKPNSASSPTAASRSSRYGPAPPSSPPPCTPYPPAPGPR